jgi:hypothetical protein
LPGASAVCSEQSCHVRTPLDANFFVAGRPNTLVASGTIVVIYDDRNLRGGRRPTGDFAVPVALSRATNESSLDNTNFSPGFWVLICLVMGMIVCCCYGASYLKKKAAAGTIEIVTATEATTAKPGLHLDVALY